MIAIYWSAGREEAARYIQGPGKEHGRPIPGTEGRAKLIGGEGFEFTVRTRADVRLAMEIMEKDTRLQASRTYPIQHPTMHMVLSWHPGYRPSREEIIEADRHFAQAIGMENARRVIWSHKEKGHFHTHTLWGQVNPDTGYAYDSYQRHERLARAGILWERERDQITPARQRDHDIAGAAEEKQAARLLGLLRSTDGRVVRSQLDKAIALGGYFGADRAAQRAGFLDHNGLTRFPANRGYSYSSKPLAEEKKSYLRDNKPYSDTLYKAQAGEDKERKRGVRQLYEDHSFEKTANPPVSRETPGTGSRNMGRINDALDWPWKKAGEVIREKWRGRSADRNRDFGKEVEEKGWDHPEVRRQWEKQYGPKREESREKQWEKQQERVRDRWDQDRHWRATHGMSPEEYKREERRENPIRSAWDKLRGKDKLPPWEKEEQRSKEALRQHGLDKAWEKAKENARQRQQDYPGQPNHPERGEAADNIAKRWKREGQISGRWEKQQQDRPIRQPQQEQENPLSKWYRDQIAKPKPDHPQPLPPRKPQERETPALPSPREIPMPKLNPDPRDQIYRPQQGQEMPSPSRQAKPIPEPTRGEVEKRNRTTRNWPSEDRETPALPRSQEIPMPKIEPSDPLPEEKRVPIWKAIRQAAEIAREKIEKDGRVPEAPQQEPNQPQAQGLPREWWKAARELEDIARGIQARGNARDQSKPQEQPQRQQEPQPMPHNEQDKPTWPGRPVYPNGRPWHGSQIPEYNRSPEQRDPGRVRAEREEQGRELPRSPPPVPNRETGRERAEREEQGRELPRRRRFEKEGPEEGREDWVPPRLRKFHNQNDIAREQSRADGTAGQGRRDETQAGQPGILPGGSHEHGSPSRQFRDQLNEDLRNIKPRQQAQEKDQERER